MRYLSMPLVLGLLMSAPFPSRAAEPTYKGKKLGEWIAALQDTDLEQRKQALEALRRLGPQAKPAVPVLCQLMRDDDRDLRRGAVRALYAVGPKAKAAVPALAGALRDPDREVRCGAADALGRLCSRVGSPGTELEFAL